MQNNVIPSSPRCPYFLSLTSQPLWLVTEREEKVVWVNSNSLQSEIPEGLTLFLPKLNSAVSVTEYQHYYMHHYIQK